MSADEEAIARVAPELRHEWDSPRLWPRIEAALAAEAARAGLRGAYARAGSWLTLAAAAAVLVVGATFLTRVGAPRPATPGAERRLLTERALQEVERAEGDHVRAIDALSRLAEPKVEEGNTSLMMSYREKLLLLDSAIAECRAHVDRNRFNARLRQELLSLYQEKQRTLQQVVNQDDDAL
jgi:hypothetical protein